MFAISPQVPPARPPMFSAIRLVASFPAGIQVGLGSPWPCLLVTYRNGPRRLTEVSSELSRFCMTRAITDRWLHRRR